MLLVDIIGPYNIRREGQNVPLIQKPLTIIYPATRWFKIVQYNGKQVDIVLNLEYMKHSYVDIQGLQ